MSSCLSPCQSSNFSLPARPGCSAGPHTLLVLAEEELVAVDLSSEGWPAHQLPYLSSLHSSAITTASYVSDCSQAAYDALIRAGEQQRQPASQKVTIS